MATNSTSELYKQLRTASINRDSAAAISILKQILQKDPQDANAARQLRQLCAATPATEQAKNASAPASSADKGGSALHARFRKACFAKDDVAAYEIIGEILKVQPNDKEAQQQRKEIASRLVRAHEGALASAVASGIVSNVCQLVEKLLSYASAEELSSLPDFAAAYSLYQSHIRKQNEETLKGLFLALVKTESEEGKARQAGKIQSFAQEKRISLTDEQKRLLEQCHAAWARVCELAKQTDTFNDLVERYKRLREELPMTSDLQGLLQTLDDIRLSVESLTEIPEAENLLAKITETRKKVITRIGVRKRQQSVKRFFAFCIVMLLLGAGGVVYYAYEHANERVAEMSTLMRERNIEGAKIWVADNNLMRRVYCRISPEYAEALVHLKKWVGEFQEKRNKLWTYEQWVASQLGHVSADTVKHIIDEITKMTLLEKELLSNFNYRMEPESLLKLELLKQEIDEKFKRETMASYTNPPADASVERLSRLYAEYRGLRDNLSFLFSEDENQSIKKAFIDRINGMVNSSADNSSALQTLYTDLKKHCATMELSNELLQSVEKKLKALQVYEKLPEKLSSCTTLEAYIQKLKENTGETYKTQLVSMEQLIPQLPLLAMRVKMARLFPSSNALSIEELYGRIDFVRRAYSAQGTIFVCFEASEYSRIVDMMTLPEKGSEWSDKYYMVRSGENVYVGSKPFEQQKEKYMRELTHALKLSRKTVKLAQDCRAELMTLAQMRQNIGVNRLELQRGTLLPVTLMHNLARTQTVGYAPLSKAYIFSLSVDLMSLVDDFSSGLVFSPTLKEDIRKFNSLKSWLAENGAALGPKCWCKQHFGRVDERINLFFEQIATHDYKREILSNIEAVTNPRIDFAGYFNQNGGYVPLKECAYSELFVYRDEKLVPMGNKETPFTPVFRVAE